MMDLSVLPGSPPNICLFIPFGTCIFFSCTLYFRLVCIRIIELITTSKPNSYLPIIILAACFLRKKELAAKGYECVYYWTGANVYLAQGTNECWGAGEEGWCGSGSWQYYDKKQIFTARYLTDKNKGLTVNLSFHCLRNVPGREGLCTIKLILSQRSK